MTAPADMGAKGTAPDGPDDAVSQDDFDRESTADRFHNRAPLSAEVLAESLTEVRDSLVALEGRLGRVAAELSVKMDGSEQRTAANARRLALEVADMGQALARRVRTLEHSAPEPTQPPPAPLVIARPAKPPPPRPRGRELALSLALAALLAAVLGGFWYWRQSAPVTAAPPPAKPPAATPTVAATPPSPPAAAAPAPAPTPPATHAWTKHPWSGTGHRPWRPAAATGSASQPSPATPSGYGAYHGPN